MTARTAIPRDDRAGMTLLEVLVAALVVSVALGAAVQAVGTAAVTLADHGDDPARARLLAEEILSLAQGLPRGPAPVGAVAKASDVVVLAQLDGQRFSPPVDARKQIIPGAGGWTQDVALVAESLPAPAGAGEVARLTVTVTQRNGDVNETFTWWVRP